MCIFRWRDYSFKLGREERFRTHITFKLGEGGTLCEWIQPCAGACSGSSYPSPPLSRKGSQSGLGHNPKALSERSRGSNSAAWCNVGTSASFQCPPAPTNQSRELVCVGQRTLSGAPGYRFGQNGETGVLGSAQTHQSMYQVC